MTYRFEFLEGPLFPKNGVGSCRIRQCVPTGNSMGGGLRGVARTEDIWVGKAGEELTGCVVRARAFACVSFFLGEVAL